MVGMSAMHQTTTMVVDPHMLKLSAPVGSMNNQAREVQQNHFQKASSLQDNDIIIDNKKP